MARRFSIFLLASSAALVLFTVSGKSRADAYQTAGAKWTPWFEMGGYYNSDDASRGEVTVFAPITQSHNSLAFIDARGKFFDEDAKEGNFAIGYRQMLPAGVNLGAWIGGDVRHSALDNTFWQLSGGFEALSHNIEARVNWYGPVSDAQAAGNPSFTQVRVAGNNIFMIGGEEVPLMGVDGEIGFRLPVEVANIDPNLFELRIFGGGFYFDSDEALEEVAGGKARVELAMNDVFASLPGSRLTAEYEFSYDEVREERHEVGARLRIPLGLPGEVRSLRSLTGQERRMLVGLERDTDIITVQSKAEAVEDALTNVDFDRVAKVNSGGSVEDVSAAKGANTLIVAKGNIQGSQTIQPNQTIQGGGSTIQVRGLSSGTVAGFTASGSRPTFSTGGGNNIRITGDNTHIAGLLLDGQGTNNNGIIVGGGKSNIVIAQNIIQYSGNDGLSFTNNNDNVRILDNVIRDINDEGIDFDNANTNITISGNTISGAGDKGIAFGNRNEGIVIKDTTIRNSSDDGIDLGTNNNVKIANVIIDGAGDDAIDMEQRNTVSITDSTVTNSEFGIYLEGNANSVKISRTAFSNLVEDGILIEGNNNDVVVADSTFTNMADAVYIFANNNEVTVSNSVITDVFDGIIIEGRRNTLNVSETAFSLIDEDAIATIDRNNDLSIVDSSFRNIGDDVFDLDRNTTILASGNTFSGTIGNDIFDFQGPNSTVLAGSTGNVVLPGATVGDEICEGAGNFSGTLQVTDQAGILQTFTNGC